MDWCRVVGPRGLCRPLEEKQVSNKQPGPRALSGLLDVRTQGRAGQSTGQGRAGQRAGQGRAGQGRAGQGQGQGRAGQGRAGQGIASTAQEGRLESASLGGAPQTPNCPKRVPGIRSLGPPQTRQKSTAPTAERSIAEQRYGPRIPGGFTLPHRPMQMVSGALGSFGFRVSGLGFRVSGLGFRA